MPEPEPAPMSPQFTKYKPEFTVGGCAVKTSGLVCGAGTHVRILALTQTPCSPSAMRDYPTMTITATVELTATVGVGRPRCDGCQARTPAPADDDALWFILKNHDGNRVVFADAEDIRNERDQYPVKGWVRYADVLLCPDCVAAVAATLRARKAAGGAP